MTAVPTDRDAWLMPWSPDPRRQARGNHTIEDILNLPSDAPRVELRDGVMIVVPSPTADHQDIGNLLWLWLRSHAPDRFRAATAIGVGVDNKNTFEPDVALLIRDRVAGDHHFFLPEQVALVVEVVSPSTRRRDRLEKPAAYADAGIRHFWRIEQDPALHLFAYRLDDSCTYQLEAESVDRLVLSQPFPIDLPIAEITP